MNRTEWQAIEAEACALVTAQLIEAEGRVLDCGQAVAWVDCAYGRTDRLGVVHRVGSFGAGIEDGRTLCGDLIPPPLRRLTLTPNLVRTLGRCRFCEHEYAHLMTETVQTGAAA